MKIMSLAMAGALLVSAPLALAQDRDTARSQSRETIQDREIYGYQLMTAAEREEYRDRMRAAQSAEEREKIRAEHHEEMQKRAQARGITLPDTPPAARGGGMMGPGEGMGRGMGGGDMGGGGMGGGGMGGGGMGRGR